MNLCNKLKEILSNFYNWFKPEEIEKPDCVLRLLKTIYPTVNWNNVHFYNRLPWFIPSSQASAITLPGNYDFTQIHIYFDNNFNPCSCAGLSTIVHEGFHVLQYTDIGIGGVGFIRLFMIYYLSCWIKNLIKYGNWNDAYFNNPMEIAAYAQEEKFNKYCNALREKICDCSTKPPTYNQNALNQLITDCPDLVKNTSGFQYNCGIIPAIIGAILDILIGVLVPVAEIVLLLGVVLLALVTGLICGLIWLWNIFVNILNIICNWTIVWEQQCTQWAQQTIQQCLEYRDNGYNACSQYQDQGYNACSQYQDQGYNACSQYQDQGYNACSQWADQGYNSCCTWWPCSWACNALVWISNWVCKGWYWVSHLVCVAWYWVTNLVCVAWYWVTHIVCVAWYWVSSWVCIAWATVVKWICVAFAWVIKKITCW